MIRQGASSRGGNIPESTVSFAHQLNTLVGDPNATETFKTIEMTGQKRLSNGWQVLTSYSATKSDIPVPAESNINPNTDILAANKTWEWLFRASSAYVFPRNVMVSANFEHRSGDVQARTVSLTGGGTIPSISLRAEPIGSLRLPHQNIDGSAGLKAVRFTERPETRGTDQSLQRRECQHGDRQDRSVGCELPEADGYPGGPDSGFQHRVQLLDERTFHEPTTGAEPASGPQPAGGAAVRARRRSRCLPDPLEAAQVATRRGLPRLKITDIKVILTQVGNTHMTNAKVLTSEPGLYGVGCGGHAERQSIVAQTIEQYLKPAAVGRYVDEIEDIWQMAWLAPYWRGSVDANNAMSAIDGALWDIMGKRAGHAGPQLVGRQIAAGPPDVRQCERQRLEAARREFARAHRGRIQAPPRRCGRRRWHWTEAAEREDAAVLRAPVAERAHQAG